jgi:hypothetical protein
MLKFISKWVSSGGAKQGTHLTISAQRRCTELELGLVMKSTVCGGDSHFSNI